MRKVLFVDDEPNILKAVHRLFMDEKDVEILSTSSGNSALKLFEKHHISVLVADQRMRGMLGTELINRVRDISPRTIRLILSGYADLATLMEAINKGAIYRFIAKPWSDEELLQHVRDALEQYNLNLKHDEQLFLALGQTIELKDTYTQGHCERVAGYAATMAEKLSFSEEMINDIRHGAWLHDCGKIGVHEDILNSHEALDKQEWLEMKKHPQNGGLVAEKAGLAPRIINIIKYHHERVDGKGYPFGLSSDDIPIEARIVAVADVYDALSTDRPYRKACSQQQAEKILLDSRGTALDGQLVDLLLEIVLPNHHTSTRNPLSTLGTKP